MLTYAPSGTLAPAPDHRGSSGGRANTTGGEKQHIRIEIDPVGPDDGAGFLVHRDLGEERRILERQKESSMFADQFVRSTVPREPSEKVRSRM